METPRPGRPEEVLLRKLAGPPLSLLRLPVLLLLQAGLVLDDLHLQAADVEGDGAQPEEGHRGDRQAVEKRHGDGEHHGAAEEEEAGQVGDAAVGDADAPEDEEAWEGEGKLRAEKPKDKCVCVFLLTLDI